MSISGRIKITLDVARGSYGNAGTGSGAPIREGWKFDWCAVKQATSVDPDWWIAPYVNCLQLKPLQLKADWSTVNTGQYAKLRLTDWESLTGYPITNYAEVQPIAAANYWLQSLNVGATIQTKRTYLPNQPFFISFKAYAHAADHFEVFEFSFGQYTAHVFANGRMQLTGGNLATEGVWGNLVGDTSKDMAGDVVKLLIQPMARRSILFWCPSHYGGWIFNDPELNEDYKNNIITSPQKLTVKFPNSQGIVQAMHVIYPLAVTEFVTPPRSFHNAPTASQTLSLPSDNLWDVPDSCGVVAAIEESDGVTPFVTDGTLQDYTIKYVLFCGADPGVTTETGQNPDGRPNWTPFIYGCRIAADADEQTRAENPEDITSDLMALSLNWGFGREGHGGILALRKEGFNVGDNFPHNRIIKVELGTGATWDTIFLGVANDPNKPNQTWNPDLNIIRWELTSLLKARSQSIQLPSHEPFDGLLIEDTVQWLFECCGFVTAADYEIPDLGGAKWPTSGSISNPRFQPQPGDTPGQWFDVIEDRIGYAVDEYWNSAQQVWKARLFHPADVPVTVSKVFYTDSATLTTAVAADHQKIWAWSERGLAPECNQIALDYCTPDGEHTIMIVDDEDSQDPAMVVASRPKNWLGETRCGSSRTDDVRKHADIDRMMAALIDKPGVMDAVRIGTFAAEYDPAVLVNTLVTITDTKRGTNNYRLLRIGMDLVNNNGTYYHRPSSYVCERKDIVVVEEPS